MFRGKKYKETAKLVEKSKLYDVSEAMELITKTATAKFDERIEVDVKFGVDSRLDDQQGIGAIVLPQDTGDGVKVLVFGKGPKGQPAKAAVADYVG